MKRNTAGFDLPAIAVRDQAKGRSLCVLATVDFARSESTSFSWEGHWAGGVHTELAVRKNQAGRTANAIDKDVVELVRELAKAADRSEHTVRGWIRDGKIRATQVSPNSRWRIP